MAPYLLIYTNEVIFQYLYFPQFNQEFSVVIVWGNQLTHNCEHQIECLLDRMYL